MAYTVLIKPSAEKQLDKLSKSIRVKIVDKLEDLCDDARPGGAVKLQGAHDFWRIRVGDYRVIYEIEDEKLIVYVVRVAHRKDAYKGI